LASYFSFHAAQQQTQIVSEEYTCPMHPEVRAGKPISCRICGMILIKTEKDNFTEYVLKLETAPARIEAGQKIGLRLLLYDAHNGTPVKQFVSTHEKLLHLFLVSQDLSIFQHLHPTQASDDAFTIDVVLPRPGSYKIYADCLPLGGTPQVLQTNLTTAGYRGDLFSNRAQLRPETHLVKKLDGIKAELKFASAEIIAGRTTTLSYHLSDTATGEPVTNLEPYLGAWGHTLILGEDAADYVHSHPIHGLSTERDSHSGPDVMFEARFPHPGNYRLWTQFQRGGRITTFPFTVRAVRLHQ
jgi:hypothetical protein